jgi:hypothetical protein
VTRADEEEVYLTLPAALGAPAEARHIFATRVSLLPDQASKAQLLVSELVTYRVRHGGLDLDSIIDVSDAWGMDSGHSTRIWFELAI